MIQVKKYRLTDDVLSNYYKVKNQTSRKKDSDKQEPIVYGRKRDVVEEVAVHGDVLIVRGKSGELFPVHIKYLQAI